MSEESRFRRLVDHLTRTRSGGKEDAEDLAQEIAIRLLKIPNSHIGCEEAYINRCTRNALIDQHRKWKRQPLEVELSEITEAAMYKAALYSDPQETLSSLDKSRLEDALELLTPRRRTIVMLHEVQGLPFKAIGEIMRLSPAQVRLDYITGIAQLAMHFQQQFGH